jgi:glutamate decarboxylase
VFEIADHLRKYGWIVPAYTMPADAQHIAVLRVVIREDFSCSLAERLVSDIEKVVNHLDTLPSALSSKSAHVAVIASETSKEVKKDITETQAEISRYWKKLVDGKRVGAC